MRRCGWSRVGPLTAVGDKLKGSSPVGSSLLLLRAMEEPQVDFMSP